MQLSVWLLVYMVRDAGVIPVWDMEQFRTVANGRVTTTAWAAGVGYPRLHPNQKQQRFNHYQPRKVVSIQEPQMRTGRPRPVQQQTAQNMQGHQTVGEDDQTGPRFAKSDEKKMDCAQC